MAQQLNRMDRPFGPAGFSLNQPHGIVFQRGHHLPVGLHSLATFWIELWVFGSAVTNIWSRGRDYSSVGLPNRSMHFSLYHSVLKRELRWEVKLIVPVLTFGYELLDANKYMQLTKEVQK